jgi:hypothetical protein
MDDIAAEMILKNILPRAKILQHRNGHACLSAGNALLLSPWCWLYRNWLSPTDSC